MNILLTAIQNVLPAMHQVLSERLLQMSTSLHLKTLSQILSETYQFLISELLRLSSVLHLKPSSLAIFALTPAIWLLLRLAVLPERKELENVEEMQDG